MINPFDRQEEINDAVCKETRREHGIPHLEEPDRDCIDMECFSYCPFIPVRSFKLLMKQYNCKVYSLANNLVYGKYRFDYRIDFMMEANSGEICHLLCCEGIKPFFLDDEYNIHLSSHNMDKLLQEVDNLWGDG